MKQKNTIFSALLIAALLSTLTSCLGRFETLNTNPNQVKGDQMDVNNYRTGTKIVSLQSLVVPMQEHQYQFIESLVGCPFAGYMGSTVDTWLTRWETYNPSDDWRAKPFKDVITELYTPYRGILSGTDDEVAIAFANLFRVAVMHRMTDSYGPIPYSNVLTTEKVKVKYDSQEEVYTTMFEELDLAIATLENNRNLSASAWNKYDRVYYGDISKWIKYANSLKLRMAMRISYVRPELAAQKASEAIAGGLILTNADNAYIHPVDNKLALIYNDWSDHRAGADILSYMSGYNDPRLEKMFTKNNPGSEDEASRKYVGLRIGSAISSKADFIENYSNMSVTPSDPVLWMNAAEVNFLLSEYELRLNNDKAKAKEHYEAGVTLSFEERGAAGAKEYLLDTEHTPELYIDPLGKYSGERKMSECKIAWDVTGDEETNLEQIITQKWIAIFPLGNEAWAEYRRTGYPRLLPAPQNLGPDPIDANRHARRLIYPIEEYNENLENLNEAISILNGESAEAKGDQMGTRVWWDVKAYR
ncbi:MAG: SusD/RagB family nutrient-binding outer membrane lipoprotein [Bacteroidales bacterium]|nr:SusD/RagB family nutrient-binding outer membrane lipoprotein [Bacteroidales bacterium]